MNTFTWGWILWMLPCVALLSVGLGRLAVLRARQQLETWGVAERRDEFQVPATVSRRSWIMAAAYLAACLALARPTSTLAGKKLRADSTQVVCVIDDSRSMGARDSGPPENRSTRLKTALAAVRTKLLPACQDNELGMVTYAGNAFPQMLFTRSRRSALFFCERIQVSDAPGNGSDMQKGFELAFTYFDAAQVRDREQGKPAKPLRRVITLFSDGGVDDKTDVQAIVDGCNQRGIELFIFGIGGTTPTAVAVKELSERDRVLAEGEFFEQGMQTALDEQVLMRLQQGTQKNGARYQRISRAEDVVLEKLVSTDTLVDSDSRTELFIYPTIAFFLCLLWASTAEPRPLPAYQP